jgi:hypothetical protein
LGKDRKQAIMDMEFPTSVKTMQHFLGSALFFRNFVPNYSDLTAKLHQILIGIQKLGILITKPTF